MTKKEKVTKKHTPPDREDLTLSVGEEVEMGKEDSSNPNWKNWIWCVSKISGLAGWIPKQYVNIDGKTGKMVKEYSSKELPVVSGDELVIHSHLNGWAFCSDASGTQGWVPDENFE